MEFPLLMAAWKIAPALATGNTVVLKPAETTPLSALRLAELCSEAGPSGRRCQRDSRRRGETGAALVGHGGIDKVAFTGSTEVGKEIRRRLAGSGRALTLELGGKGAHVVFDDAPLDQAVEGVVNGIFFNQGQVCCAGKQAAGAGVDGASEFVDRSPPAAVHPAGGGSHWTRTPT